MAFCASCGTEVLDPTRPMCVRCGNPVGGNVAPRPAASSTTPLVLIGVIVAIPIIIAIVGILAAIAIPNMLTALQRSRQKRTMADIRAIATAAEAYHAEKNHYPKALHLNNLETELVPTYIRNLPRLDGWGQAYKYTCWSSTPSDPDGGEWVCDTYAIGSGGRNKQFEHELREYTSAVPTTNFDCDIVYSNGSFRQWPEGVYTP